MIENLCASLSYILSLLLSFSFGWSTIRCLSEAFNLYLGRPRGKPLGTSAYHPGSLRCASYASTATDNETDKISPAHTERECVCVREAHTHRGEKDDSSMEERETTRKCTQIDDIPQGPSCRSFVADRAWVHATCLLDAARQQ